MILCVIWFKFVFVLLLEERRRGRGRGRVCERERQRDRETKRQSDRETERQRDRATNKNKLITDIIELKKGKGKVLINIQNSDWLIKKKYNFKKVYVKFKAI